MGYEAGGITREGTATVGGSIFSSTGLRVFPAPRVTLARMREWIGRHPAGSRLRIHYDPANAENLSLAGEDDELRTGTPHDRLIFGALACGAGLVMIAFGGMARRRQE